MNFIKRIKYAEHKTLCICIDVYKVFKRNDFNKFNEALSTLKIKKM